MTMRLMDSHAHLSDETLIDQVEGMVQRAQAAGLYAVVNICTDVPSLRRGLVLQQQHPHFIFNSAAVPPHDVVEKGEADFGEIQKCAKEGLLVAVGETGLDYFHHAHTKDLQKHFLRAYLHLALETSLPVVIHCREAFSDFFEILDAEYQTHGKHGPGVLHCFTGTPKEAEEVLKRGWFLSLSGIVTFKKNEELRQIAKTTPLNQLLIETDAPYLAPQAHRGKVNEPAFLVETAKVIAEVKGISLEELVEATCENAKRLFLQPSNISRNNV